MARRTARESGLRAEPLNPDNQDATGGKAVVTDRGGAYGFRIVCGEDTPESRKRWDRRGEALAAWLLPQWKREHGDR